MAMRAVVSGLPAGSVTFLFTDVEGSTRLWEEHAEIMGDMLPRHDQCLRSTIEASGGYVFKTVGDAFCAAFASPSGVSGSWESFPER